MIKKRGIYLILVILIISNFNVFALLEEFERKEDDTKIVSSSKIQQTGSLTTVNNALSFQNNEFLTSNAAHVEYDQATKELSVKSADVLVLKDLDAVQLQDARLKNRICK